MSKGKNLIGNRNNKKKKIVTKEVGENISTTYSTETTNSPQTNVVQTPPIGSNQGTIMYWPSPQTFYQQGKELAKKAYNEYLNAANQYQNVPPNQFDLKMQQAGQMNNLAQSMVQGIAIGTEAAENIQKRIRTGDQTALIEIEAVKDTLSKLLKTVHVHNKAASSGQFAGLEAKLLESTLVTRLNQATQLQSTNYGIPVSSPEEADTIWIDPEMPAPGVEGILPEEQVSDSEVPPDESATDIPTDPSQGEIVADQSPSPEEEFPSAEETPPSEEEEEIPVDFEEESTEEISEEDIPETEENIEKEVPEEEEPEIEETEEEIPEENENVEELDEDGLPLPSGPDGYYTKEDMLKYGEMIIDQISEEDEEIENEEIPEEENEEIENEEIPEEEDEVEEESSEDIEEDEDGIYCIGCDKYVSPEEIESCNDPNCPFKNGESEKESPEEETDEEEIPIDMEEKNSEEDEVPVDFEEETKEVPVEEDEEKEKGIKNDIVEKHFIMVGTDDHSDHNVKEITIKEFTGLEGEYCLDCHKIVSYSFDQNSWSSEDAKNWVNKQNKINKQKNISTEEIINKSLDNIPEEVLKEWVDDRSSTEKVEKGMDEIDIEFEEVKEIFSGDVFKNILEKAFEPMIGRLKNLEA